MNGLKEMLDGSGKDFSQLESLINNVPGIVYRGLRDWSLTFIGAEVKRITGYAPADLLAGRVRWVELIHPDDLPSVRKSFKDAVAAGKTVLRVEYRIRHQGGGLRWLADRRQLIYGDDGLLAYVDGLLLDITDAKRSEEALLEREHHFHAIVDTATDAIVTIDPLGKVLLFNPGAERMFGYRADEILGRGIELVIPARFRSAHAGGLARIASTGEQRIIGKTIELQALRKDGSEFPVELSLAVWTGREGARFTGIIRDISARKRAEESLRSSEEQLRQAQKMEAVGRLAGGVAHDFNNLLTAIRGYSDLLLMRIGEQSPLREDLEEIRKAGDRAASLTQQLLAFSRRQVLQPKVVDLNAVVANLDRMLRRLIGEDVDLIVVLRPGLWPVTVDPGQIEQVIMNLVVNARDAMPRGGKIVVETSNVELDAAYMARRPVAAPGSYAVISVSDTGCGMDEETKSRLFEPFFTTKGKGKGTGLGLSTVYGIVKQSGGYVWVYSEVGRGASFKVYLPRHGEETREPESRDASEVPPKGKETILLVEDEEIVRSLAAEVLARNGYKVLCASDGSEALEIARNGGETVDLMITDVVMPKMGGRDLVETLTASRPDLKVLYMSAYADEAIVHHGVLDQGTPFLSKPFTLEALLRKTRELLDG